MCVSVLPNIKHTVTAHPLNFEVDVTSQPLNFEVGYFLETQDYPFGHKQLSHIPTNNESVHHKPPERQHQFIEQNIICDAIMQNESEVKKYNFWLFGIFC